MKISELKNYSEEGLKSLLKSKENEINMLQETYEEAVKNINSSEGGLGFLVSQIRELENDSKMIQEYMDTHTEDTTQNQINYISSNAIMADLINRINENNEDDEPKPLEKKRRPSRYKVATNNNFTVDFTSMDNIDSSQIKTINFALAGDKRIIVEFFDYVYTSPQNEKISIEKVIYDAKKNNTATDICISSFAKDGEILKSEIFSDCAITDIYTRGMYDYSDSEIRTISAVFSYNTFDVHIPQVKDETSNE